MGADHARPDTSHAASARGGRVLPAGAEARGQPAGGHLDEATRSGPHRLACPRHADVAQLAERRLPKPKVAGSTPVVRYAKSPGDRGFSLRRPARPAAFEVLPVG